jgi:STE24 endopeptidase
MFEQAVLIVFLLFFIAHFLIERWLAIVNIRYVLARQSEIPDELKAALPTDYAARSAQYAQARTRFGHASAIFSAVLTLVFLFSGLIPWLDVQVRALPFGELTYGVLLIGIFAAIGDVLHLPFEIYGTFVLEARFGFNRTTVRTFILDKLKGVLLALVLGVPFLYALLAFISGTGSLWWLWAALFVIGFQLVMTVLYPLIIAPLFNKFTPLVEGELKQSLEALAQKCSFATRGIFVMDGSKRSAHSNAYFTGLGKARRIVLFDTLVQQMTVAEIDAILAHEIGHYKRKHIPKFLALASLGTIAGFLVLSLLLYWPPLYGAFRWNEMSVPLGLLLFGLISGHLVFWTYPIFNWLSRKFEYEADAYAGEQAGAPPMISALIKLFEKNLATLKPHPLYSAYHYSHPTLLERVGALQQQG